MKNKNKLKLYIESCGNLELLSKEELRTIDGGGSIFEALSHAVGAAVGAAVGVVVDVYAAGTMLLQEEAGAKGSPVATA